MTECVYCGKPLTRREVTRDHVIPESRGGSNERYNIAPACADCNSEKGSLTAAEYLAVRGNRADLKTMRRKVNRQLPAARAEDVMPGKRPVLTFAKARAIDEIPAHARVAWAIEQNQRRQAITNAEAARARARAEGRRAGT